MPDVNGELWDLLNALCERHITPAQAARLEAMVLASPEARWHYLTYLHLHGTLYWDAAGGLAIRRLPADADLLSTDLLNTDLLNTDLLNTEPLFASADTAVSSTRKRHRTRLWVSVAGLAAVVVMAVLMSLPAGIPPIAHPDVVQESSDHDPSVVEPTPTHVAVGPRQPIQLPPSPLIAQQPTGPSTTDPSLTDPSTAARAVEPTHPTVTAPLDPQLPASVQRPVALINHLVRTGWETAGITPSERADDAAWLRRVYLDLAGHIPSANDARRFLADRRADKRHQLVDRLLDDPAFVRQLTTRWTNLLVGRVSGAQVNRPALEKFLRTSFAGNRGWDEIVTELVAAEGRSDENGAANFLIAHLNNQAVPATAITARLFLGVQVQCTQCHNHPSGLAKQTDFWEFNSFFHQTQAVLLTERDPATGQMKSQVTELVSQSTGGPTYYETPNGVMKAVYPKYHDRDISPDPEVNRRQELAKLMVEEDGDQLAQAFINRMWQQFFGFGFTRSVDDMGPHNPASHPELLAGLSESFRQSGYDIKQLTRWICLSEPYQLSSRFNDSNRNDDPERGESPLFSRVYPQPMSVEQLYDSFLVATKAHQAGVTDWTAAESQRQAWLQQFIVSFQTEENDEANTFDGTVTQALTLMNGPLIDKALETTSGTYLGEVLRAPGNETEKIEQLCLAALSRKPSSKELAAMHKLIKAAAQRTANSQASSQPAGVEGYQDLFWALLNSNEFAVVY